MGRPSVRFSRCRPTDSAHPLCRSDTHFSTAPTGGRAGPVPSPPLSRNKDVSVHVRGRPRRGGRNPIGVEQFGRRAEPAGGSHPARRGPGGRQVDACRGRARAARRPGPAARGGGAGHGPTGRRRRRCRAVRGRVRVGVRLEEGAARPTVPAARLLPGPAGGAGVLLRARPAPRRVPQGAAEVPVPADQRHPAVVLRRGQLRLPRRPEEHRARLLRPAQAGAARRQLAVHHRGRVPHPVRDGVQRPARPAGQHVQPEPRPRVHRPVVPRRLPRVRRVHRRVVGVPGPDPAAHRPAEVGPAERVRRHQVGRRRRRPGVRPPRPPGAAARLAAARLAARLGEHPADVPGACASSARRRSGTSTRSGCSRSSRPPTGPRSRERGTTSTRWTTTRTSSARGRPTGRRRGRWSTPTT